MVLENENCQIHISEQPCIYDIKSADNKHYDMVINTCPKNKTKGTNIEASIYVWEKGEPIGIIFLAPYCTIIGQRSAILSNYQLIVLLDYKIVVMDLHDMSYRIKEILQPFGTYYDIYKCDSGYIVYGELEIIMLDENFSKCWHYCTQDIDILRNRDQKALTIQDGHIMFYDWDGNCHKLDMNGNLCEYKKHEIRTVKLDVNNINTPKEFQKLLKEKLELADWYGMNWDAFWDIGLGNLPDELILDGWHIYKSKQKQDALMFEEIMKKYNESKYREHCECIYLYYK